MQQFVLNELNAGLPRNGSGVRNNLPKHKQNRDRNHVRSGQKPYKQRVLNKLVDDAGASLFGRQRRFKRSMVKRTHCSKDAHNPRKGTGKAHRNQASRTVLISENVHKERNKKAWKGEECEHH